MYYIVLQCTVLYSDVLYCIAFYFSKPAHVVCRPEGPGRCKGRLVTKRQNYIVGLGKTFLYQTGSLKEIYINCKLKKIFE